MCNCAIYRFFCHFENGNLALPSPLLKQGQSTNPVSQQRFRPSSLMAQCSLYDVRWLKGRSVLLFCSNLMPKLFKHQGFSSIHSIQSVCLSLWGREGAGGGNRWTKCPVRKADIHTAKLAFLRFTCKLTATIKAISIKAKRSLTFMLSNILVCSRITVVAAGFHFQPLHIQMQSAVKATPFNHSTGGVVWRKNTTSLC